jgi:hypothetical protein
VPICRSLVAAFAVSFSACAGAAPIVGSAVVPSPVPAITVAPPLPIAPNPDVDLVARDDARVRGHQVAFDGDPEGLAWPSLDSALGPRSPGGVVTLQAARDVRVVDVLRAAWTARAGDLRLQTPDASGVMRVAELGARRTTSPAAPGCHLAVFLRPDGSLRIAAPGGPREVGGDRAAESLARSLEQERAKCPIKYVAFGAETDEGPWGPVFDVILAVDRARSAGDARYVLGQATRAVTK